MRLVSSITTVFAPVWFVNLHSNFLKNAGISSQYYFFDKPEVYTDKERDTLRSNCNAIFCDSAYWEARGGRPERIAQRQEINIAFAREKFELNWIFHVDIDEFPHFKRSLANVLDGLVPEVREVRMQNVERVSLTDTEYWCDGILRLICADRDLMDRFYGKRANFLGMGLANYIHGKSIVKNTSNVIQSVHGALARIPNNEIVRYWLKPSEAVLVHYPMLSSTHLIEKMRRKSRPNQRLFRHEQRAIEYVRAQKNQLEAAKEIINALHFCSTEEAQRWIDAGLCMTMPGEFRQLFTASCGDARFLTRPFIERSFQEFYARKPLIPV